jgi:hypothetical protein
LTASLSTILFLGGPVPPAIASATPSNLGALASTVLLIFAAAIGAPAGIGATVLGNRTGDLIGARTVGARK